MLFSDALNGFNIFIRSEGYSDSTVDLYSHDLNLLVRHLGDKELDKVTEDDLTEFLVYLREVYHKEIGRDKSLSGSTLQNYWKAIRTFFGWAKRQKLIFLRPDQDLRMPRSNPKIIMPLSQEEVKKLIECAAYAKVAATHGRASYKMKRHSALRDVAIVILLLDTGVRAGELARLNMEDVDLQNSEIMIKPFGSSQRKTKSRSIPLGKAANRALWHHMLANRKDTLPDDPVFITKNGIPMCKGSVLQLIRSLGNKAGIRNCHTHRLRHTFAIEYLRNGGDVFTLKSILVHGRSRQRRHRTS